MAALPKTTAAAGASVVGPQYCCAHPVQMVIKRKSFSMTDLFEITDENSNQLLFKVSVKHFSLRNNRTILDAAGVPILTLRQKMLSGTWQVFRGESSDSSNLVCSVKREFAFFKTKLKVYLSYNTTRQLCDFKLVRGFGGNSCVVYAGESNTNVVAQIRHKSGFVKDKFMVTVSPNIDHAFIASVIVILDAIDSSSRASATSSSVLATSATSSGASGCS